MMVDKTSSLEQSGLGDLANPACFRAPLNLRNRDTEELLEDYRSMVLIRRTEEAIAELVTQKKAVCPCHLAIGQEAVAVGVAKSLRPDDRCYGAHRSHGHYLALGAPVEALLAEVLGKETGCSKGMGGSMHLFSEEHGFGGSVPIVAGTVPIAVGAALAFKSSGRDSVGVAFFGDGACEEGIVHESLNMAAIMKLPVIFVVENNLFSSHLDIDLRQPNNRVARFADAHSIPAVSVDGNDVVEVSEAMSDFVKSAREGNGPGFLEAVTYRWRGHVGPNEDIDVGLRRKPEDIRAWKNRDPIARLKASLESDRTVSEREFSRIDREIDELLAEALLFAENSPYPPANALLDRVYAKGSVA